MLFVSGSVLNKKSVVPTTFSAADYGGRYYGTLKNKETQTSKLNAPFAINFADLLVYIYLPFLLLAN